MIIELTEDQIDVLISSLNSAIVRPDWVFEQPGHLQKLLDLRTLLKEQPPVMKRAEIEWVGWIPCNERVPDKKTVCLVWLGQWGNRRVEIATFLGKDKWYLWAIGKMLRKEDGPTHWAYLPLGPDR